jgi:DNA polymerase-1
MSCTDPNMQQVPREREYRACVKPVPGRVLVKADYSQIELRIAAMLANEQRMLRAFAQGKDMHLETAAGIMGKIPEHITKEERKKAKAVNFGFLFSMGWEKFIIYAKDNYDVEFTEAQAKAYRDRYFEMWPGLHPWHERQRRLARRHKRVHSPLGRVRHLPDMDSSDKGVRAESERQAINSPVQSTASDIMLTAAMLLEKKGIPVIGLVHDAGLFEVPEDQSDDACATVKEVMENDALNYLKHKFGTEITVPIVAEVEVGTHWSEGKPYG